MTPDSASPEAAAKVRFLDTLAANGIVLPPDLAEAAAADFLILDQQMQLIRAELAPEAPVPLGFVALVGAL